MADLARGAFTYAPPTASLLARAVEVDRRHAAIGLGFIIQFHTCLSMFAGALLFWLVEMFFFSKESRMNQVVVQNQEPICAGLIVGQHRSGRLIFVIDLWNGDDEAVTRQ